MRKGIGIGTLMLGLTVAASGAWAEEEEEIALDKVPAEVMKAVKDKFEGAKISEASKEEEDGKTIYEIELTHEGSEYDVAVSSEGKILEIEREIDEDKLPEAVSRALKEKYPNLEIAKVEEITKDGKTGYEVVLETEVVLDPDGKIVETEDDDDDKEKDDN